LESVGVEEVGQQVAEVEHEGHFASQELQQ
jgi:hypothetical protein